MRIFVTGATGFIGSAVVLDLLAAGHKVVGLARSDASAKALKEAGAEAHRGQLDDPESLAQAAKAADGVIHLAYIHDDFTKMAQWAAIDQKAVAAMVAAVAGSNKPLVITSGTAMLASQQLATEAQPVPKTGIRAASETTGLEAAAKGVRSSVVRLPPTVHGQGDHAFVPMLIETARKQGYAAYVGEGNNRWPAVHRLDAARLFRLACEKAAAGTPLHGVAEEGIPMRSIAEAIGRGLGLPVRSITQEQAAAYFTWMAHFATIDNPTSSAVTRKSLGWQPQHPALLPDMRDHYFVKA